MLSNSAFMLSVDIQKAIEICLELNIPFVAYILPKSANPVFYANPSALDESRAVLDGRKEFIISLFNNDYPYIIGIQPEISESEVIRNADKLMLKPTPEIFPWSVDTEYIQYKSQLSQIISKLKLNEGKTVLSKVKTGRMRNDWLDEINSKFIEYTTTFRCIYFTRETGCWFCATPEVLLEVNHQENILSTMSLAGTRLIKRYSNQSWDVKNIEEHNFVTDYIVNELTKLGMNPIVGEQQTIEYGVVEHLCHKIQACMSNIDIKSVLTSLSPTPAVAGYPKDTAIDMINRYEVHPRYCYSGFVGVGDSDGLHVYVNLRCGHTDGKNVCLYSGGGLTKMSVAKEEWLETEAKIRVFADLINED